MVFQSTDELAMRVLIHILSRMFHCSLVYLGVLELKYSRTKIYSAAHT